MRNRQVLRRILAMTAISLIAVAETRAGQMWLQYSTDFQGTVGPEWSSTTTEVTPIGGRRFLGRFGAQSVTLTLAGLRLHGMVHLSFDLFIIGSWDGNYANPGAGPDIWDLSVPNQGITVLHTTFNTHTFAAQYQAYPDWYPGGQYPSNTGAVEVATLGYSCSGSCTDAVYHLDLTFDHTLRTLVLVFSGVGLESLANESWGLDNLSVWSESPPPPDFDDDGDLDEFDLTYFLLCMAGPESTPRSFPGCKMTDIDGDADVDQNDFGYVQRCLSGYDIPTDPFCTD